MKDRKIEEFQNLSKLNKLYIKLNIKYNILRIISYLMIITFLIFLYYQLNFINSIAISIINLIILIILMIIALKIARNKITAKY